MRFLLILFVVCACALSAAAEDPFPAADALLPQHMHAANSGPSLTLDEIERMALAGNPEIEVAARRLAAVQAHVPVSGALDDPSVTYRGWGVPLRQPWDYNAAQNMFMVSQSFPGWGKRRLRAEVARSDVTEAKAALDNSRLQVRIEVRKAFYDLLRAQDEMRVHDEHIAIARQAVEAARIKYTVGKVPQQDILKAQVELTRLAEHLVHFDEDAEIARAQLNTLLGRDPGTPIQVEGEYTVPSQLPGMPELEKLALASRPDLAEAQAAIEKAVHEQTLAQKGFTPDFNVAAGYMLMPGDTSQRNRYMVEGSLNLPWLNRGRHNAEISEAKAKASEQEAELGALRNAAFGQIQEALARAKAARRLADIYHVQLQPQAEATLRSTVIAYENDRTDFLNLLDSQTTVVDIDLAYFQAIADFESRFADLELAVGAPLARTADAPGRTQ